MKPTKYLLMILPFWLIVPCNCNDEDMLIKFVTDIPDLSEMPQTRPINVHFEIDLNNVLDIDQSHNLVTIAAYFTLNWSHSNISWNPSDFGSMESVVIDAYHFWIPEIHFYYSAENVPTIQKWANSITVDYTGMISQRISFSGKTYCPTNVKRFPFDRHNCDFIFGDWIHSNKTIVFQTAENGTVMLENLLDNQEWYLLDAHSYAESMESHSIIRLHIFLRRESFYYIFNLVIPATLMTLTAVFGFHAPQKSDGKRESKAQLGICTLMPMGVLLLTVMGNMPKFSTTSVPGKRGSFSGLPLLALYYLGLLSVISIGTWVTMLFVLLEKYAINQTNRPPKWLRWLTFTCCKKQKTNLGVVDGLKQFFLRQQGGKQKSMIKAFDQNHNRGTKLAPVRESQNVAMREEILEEEWKNIIDNLTKISLIFHLLIILVLIMFLFSPDWYEL